MFVTRIDYLVAFYSKSNRLSLSLFTVNPVAIVGMSYLQLGDRNPLRIVFNSVSLGAF